MFRIAAVNAAGTGPFVTTKPIRMDAPCTFLHLYREGGLSRGGSLKGGIITCQVFTVTWYNNANNTM